MSNPLSTEFGSNLVCETYFLMRALPALAGVAMGDYELVFPFFILLLFGGLLTSGLEME